MDPEENIETQQEINETLGMANQFQNAEVPADSGLELFEKVLINTDTNPNKETYDELRPYVATGYMDKDELDALKRIHSVLSNADNIFQTIIDNLEDGQKTDGANLKQIQKLLLRKLFFMSYSSKSKNGFTVLELNSQHTYRHENLYQKQAFDEEEGPLAGLKKKMGQAADKGMSSDRQIWPEEKKSNEIW